MQRFVFGGAGTICPTEKKWENIAALAHACGLRATVRCSRKARGWRGLEVAGTKRFGLSHVLYTRALGKGVGWYLAETLTRRLKGPLILAYGDIL